MIKEKNRKWDYDLAIKKIKKDGYFVFENFFSKDNIKEIKNSLLETLNYIQRDNEKDLVKKYFKIKKFNQKLKGNWYDMARYNLTLYKFLHSQDVITLVKKFFKSNVIFSARPAIHVHDSTNDFLLEPHQETAAFSRDGILLWAPMFDTNRNNGGLTIWKNSHKHGFFPHKIEPPEQLLHLNKKQKKDPTGKKVWTKDYTNIDKSIYSQFEKINLSVKAGSAVFMINRMIHAGYPMKSKNKIRLTLTERFNPLQNLPYLKKENAPQMTPYTTDLNKINFDRFSI